LGDARIRPARAQDAATVAAIAHAAYVKYVPRIGRQPAPMSTDYAASIAAGHVTVIERNETVAGYLIGGPDGESFFIKNIAVDPVHQGNGLGGALLRYAVAEACSLKLSSVRLCTNAAMTENRALYEHFGFVETHRALEHGYDRVYMRLSL
jgi:ribosomal protein S18 acetylase RimI-like enzyme